MDFRDFHFNAQEASFTPSFATQNEIETSIPHCNINNTACYVARSASQSTLIALNHFAPNSVFPNEGVSKSPMCVAGRYQSQRRYA
jgi:hypothetical protein